MEDTVHFTNLLSSFFPRSFVFLSSIVVRQLCFLHQVLFKYAYYVIMFTLGQFIAYQFDRQLVSELLAFLYCYMMPKDGAYLDEKFSHLRLELSDDKTSSSSSLLKATYTSQSWPLFVPCQETQMAAVQLTFVKKLQTKRQETYYTILKYRNEITISPSFVSIGLFLRACFNFFVKKREI